MDQRSTEQGSGSPKLQNPLALRHQHNIHHVGKTTLVHCHATSEQCATYELTPPHPPRVETAAYRAAHKRLTEVLDAPCIVCGVRKSTLHDASLNKFGASAIETHHWPIERSLIDACDPVKVGEKFSEVTDHASLLLFVDSERNLMVLCDVHHRSLEQGIHHLLCQDFAILPYLFDGYQVVASVKDRDMAIQHNDQIEKEHGME
jgi:hypothetical protein